MSLSSRLSVVAAVAIAGLVPTLAASAAAALATHTRQGVSPTSTTSGTAPLWAERFKGTVGNTEGFADVVSPDGATVFATGSVGVNTPRAHTSGVTVAYTSATGATLWQTQYNALNFRNFSFAAIAVSPDGTRVYVTGTVTGSRHPGLINAVTAAYNASTGALIWAKTSTPVGGINNRIAVSPDGAAVFMADGTATVAYSAATGAVLWSHSKGGSVVVSPTGSAVFVLGTGAGLTAYNPATGTVLWTVAGPRSTSNGFAVSPDGSKVYVTGSYLTTAYDAATGTTLWTKKFQMQNHIGYSDALVVSPDGSKVFVTGYMSGPTPSTGWGTVAYDAQTGAQLWVVHFRKRIQDISGIDAAISPDGSKVFVTGITSATSGAGEFGTAAYDAATGALLWIGSYSPPGFSGISRSIAVSPDGSKVLVTGAIWIGPSNNNPTMVTAAYNS